MMFGFMIIEMESLDELKQTSGNEFVLFKEEKFACNVVEALEDLTTMVCEKKIVKRSRKSLENGIAMKLLLHEQ